MDVIDKTVLKQNSNFEFYFKKKSNLKLFSKPNQVTKISCLKRNLEFYLSEKTTWKFIFKNQAAKVSHLLYI